MINLVPEAFNAAWTAHPLPDPKYEVWIKLFLSDAIKAYLESENILGRDCATEVVRWNAP